MLLLKISRGHLPLLICTARASRGVPSRSYATLVLSIKQPVTHPWLLEISYAKEIIDAVSIQRRNQVDLLVYFHRHYISTFDKVDRKQLIQRSETFRGMGTSSEFTKAFTMRDLV